MPYNFVADIFHTKKLYSRLSLSEVRFYLGGLAATYDDRLRLIEKRVDFLLVLIELFRQVLRLRRYERISVQNQRFRFKGDRLTQNFR